MSKIREMEEYSVGSKRDTVAFDVIFCGGKPDERMLSNTTLRMILPRNADYATFEKKVHRCVGCVLHLQKIESCTWFICGMHKRSLAPDIRI